MEIPDISEKGAPRDGQPQCCNRRFFMQLLAFGDCTDSSSLALSLQDASIDGVLYEDLNDPRGVALLVMHEDPAHFVTGLRRMLNRAPFSALSLKSRYTMFGRTYALGYEPDLTEALFRRPRRTVLYPDWPWAIWYPLRRRGSFAQLAAAQQRDILLEHSTIGRAFGRGDYAHDVRLACHGLDEHDNDFVIGLIGRQLHPLSAIVQAMRQTRQTSCYIERLGPFFIGKVLWQSSV